MRSYQEEDRHLVDYRLATVPGLPDWGESFRGPHPTGSGFVAFLGAAQTFGRLCAEPFPALVGRALSVETANLGHGGAGPEFYQQSALLDGVRGASVVVVQIMSARSQSSPHFRSDEGLMAGVRVADGRPMVAEELFEELLEDEPSAVPEVVRGFQEASVASTIELLKALAPTPTVLLWFSVQVPPCQVSQGVDAREVLGTFPQLVTADMVEAMRPHATAYVECACTIGLPRTIVDEAGRPSSIVLDYRLSRPEQYTVTTDNYYPSPEMHLSAAVALIPVLGPLLQLASTA